MATPTRSKAACVATVLVLIGLLAPGARGDDFWRRLARGLNFFGWDIQANQHLLRDGWQLNSARVFNAQTFDMGTHDLYLNGPVVVQTAIAKRFIPTLDIRANTQGQNLRAIYSMNTGIQDAFIDNTINATLNFNINLLGFYDLNLELSNRGDYVIDGFLLADDGSTDFDVGPMSLSGNIWLDVINVLTNPLGLPTPGALISGRATKPWNAEESANVSVGKQRLLVGDQQSSEADDTEAEEQLSHQELREQIVLAVLEEIQQRPVFQLFGILSQADGPQDVDLEAIRQLVEELASTLPAEPQFDLSSLFLRPLISSDDDLLLSSVGSDEGQEGQSLATVPEPTSLLLVASGLLVGWRRRLGRST